MWKQQFSIIPSYVHTAGLKKSASPGTTQFLHLQQTLQTLKFKVFLVVVPCSHVEVDRCFRGAYCLHHRPDDGGSTYL
jgi:hypothetical protein